MSMHDIEDVVECSIHCIDRSDLPLDEKRNLIYNLYRFQEDYDTGYTHFRVKDILVKYHYLFVLPIHKHPDYAERAAEFDELAQTGQTAWLTDDSYFEKNERGRPLFYFDAGSKTWQKLVSRSVLKGLQVLSVKEIPLYDMILEIIRLCREQQDTYCAAQWFTTILRYILGDVTEEDKPKLQALSGALFNHSVFSVLRDDQYFRLELDPENYEELPPTVRTWLNAFLEWDRKQGTDPEALMQQAIQAYTKREFGEALRFARKGLQAAPEHVFLRLYEYISNIMLLYEQGVTDINQYHPWMDQMAGLYDENSGDADNNRTVRMHCLYYKALSYTACRDKEAALRITDELIRDYQMDDARLLKDYLNTLNN